MKYPLIETERLFLRRPTAADHDLALRHFGGARCRATAPLTGPEAWMQLAQFLGHWTLMGHGLFAVVPQGEDAAIGFAGPWSPTGWAEPEIGWLFWADDACASLAAEAVSAANHFAQRGLGWGEPLSYIGCEAELTFARLLGCVTDPFAQPTGRAHVTALRHPPLARRIRDAA